MDVETNTAPLSERLLSWVDRRRHWVFAALALLYALSITGRWRVAPDTALYMSLGRSLAEGDGFTYHGVRHNWYEPGLPWVIGVSFRLFGHDNYWPLTLFTLACGVLALSLAYRLFKLYAGRPTAVLLTALLALTETFYRYCFQVVTDMPFLAGLFAVLLGYERLMRPAGGGPGDGRTGPPDPTAPAGPADPAGRRSAWWAWALLFFGSMVMCAFRPTIITFLGALGVATAWHVLRGPGRLQHALVAAVVVAGVVAFRVSDPRRTSVADAAHREATLKNLLTERLGWAVHRTFTRFLPDMLSEQTPEAILGIELGAGVDQVFSVVAMGLGVALVTRRVLWGAWVAATLAQMAFWLPRERYFLPILPLLLIAFWQAALWLERRLKAPAGRFAFAGVVLLLFVPNLLQDGVFIAEQRWRGITATDLRDPTARPLVEMGRLISEHVGEGDTVLAEASRELTYFSRRKVVEPPQARRQPPTADQERRLEEQILAHERLFVVLPEEWRQKHLETLIAKLRLRPGPELGRVDQPGVKNRPPKPPLVLHRLVPQHPAPAPPPSPPPASTRPSTSPR